MSFLQTLFPDLGKEDSNLSKWVDLFTKRDESRKSLESYEEGPKESIIDKLLNGFGTYHSEGTGAGTTPEVQQQLEQMSNVDEYGNVIQDTQPVMEPTQPVVEPETESKFVWQTDDKQPFPKEWDDYVDASASNTNNDPNILASLIANESGHNWQGNVGDSGASFGITQVQYPTYKDVANYFGEDVMTEEEFKQAVNDPATAIDIASKVLRYKTDVFADGDTFLGVARYNGDGPQSIEYAKAVYNRIGYPIPDGY